MKFQTRGWQLVNQLFSLRRLIKLCIARDSCFANIFMVDKENKCLCDVHANKLNRICKTAMYICTLWKLLSAQDSEYDCGIVYSY